MARATVVVSGIGAEGRHGANEGERDDAQPFVVDLEVEVDATADSIEGTVDYRAIAEAARQVVEGSSFTILESLADAVARSIRDLEGVLEVTATVRKPRAAESLDVAAVAARVTLA